MIAAVGRLARDVNRYRVAEKQMRQRWDKGSRQRRETIGRALFRACADACNMIADGLLDRSMLQVSP